MKWPAENMFQGASWWIWNLAASTPFARRRSAPCSSQTILFTRTMVPEIIGPKGITLKERSWLIKLWMLCDVKPKIAIHCKAFKYVTRLAAEQAVAWEHYWFPRFAKNIRIV